MSAILNESTITLYQAAEEMPSNSAGKRTNFSTIWRWCLRGIIGPNGERIRLEAVRVGGRWLTSREAIARFSAALTPELGGKAATERTPAERKRAASSASKRLEAIGI